MISEATTASTGMSCGSTQTNELPLPLRVGDDVGDDVGDGRLGRGAGSPRDRHDRNARVRGRGDALERPDVLELRVGRDDPDGLARVLRGAAAHRDQHVGARGPEGGDTALHVLDRRVRCDVREHLIGKAGLVQQARHVARDAGAHQHAVDTTSAFAKPRDRSSPGTTETAPAPKYAVWFQIIRCATVPPRSVGRSLDRTA
jgi:hypothetical protein